MMNEYKFSKAVIDNWVLGSLEKDVMKAVVKSCTIMCDRNPGMTSIYVKDDYFHEPLDRLS